MNCRKGPTRYATRPPLLKVSVSLNLTPGHVMMTLFQRESDFSSDVCERIHHYRANEAVMKQAVRFLISSSFRIDGGYEQTRQRFSNVVNLKGSGWALVHAAVHPARRVWGSTPSITSATTLAGWANRACSSTSALRRTRGPAAFSENVFVGNITFPRARDACPPFAWDISAAEVLSAGTAWLDAFDTPVFAQR